MSFTIGVYPTCPCLLQGSARLEEPGKVLWPLLDFRRPCAVSRPTRCRIEEGGDVCGKSCTSAVSDSIFVDCGSPDGLHCCSVSGGAGPCCLPL